MWPAGTVGQTATMAGTLLIAQNLCNFEPSRPYNGLHARAITVFKRKRRADCGRSDGEDVSPM
jgi:hypothetical protein